MFPKFLNIFKTKKQRFKDKLKKEKSQLYLRKKRKKNFYGNNKRKKKKQLQIGFKIEKKEIIFISLFGILSTIFSLFFIFYGNYFSIKNIHIQSNDEVSNINIAYKSIDSLRGKNIFLTNKLTIKQLLQSYQPNISSTSINKEFPNKLNITINSYPILFEAKYNNKSYHIISNGIAIPKIKEIQNQETPITLNMFNGEKNTLNSIAYKHIIAPDVLKKIYALTQTLKHNLIDIHISDYSIYKKEREIHLLTNNNTLLIFDYQGDINEQAKKLVIFNKENPSFKKIYLDLRIKNKIFYCDYENEYQCRINLKRLYSKK